jgi:hypothetical protein
MTHFLHDEKTHFQTTNVKLLRTFYTAKSVRLSRFISRNTKEQKHEKSTSPSHFFHASKCGCFLRTFLDPNIRIWGQFLLNLGTFFKFLLEHFEDFYFPLVKFEQVYGFNHNHNF